MSSRGKSADSRDSVIALVATRHLYSSTWLHRQCSPFRCASVCQCAFRGTGTRARGSCNLVHFRSRRYVRVPAANLRRKADQSGMQLCLDLLSSQVRRRSHRPDRGGITTRRESRATPGAAAMQTERDRQAEDVLTNAARAVEAPRAPSQSRVSREASLLRAGK